MQSHSYPAQLALPQAEAWELASPMDCSPVEFHLQERREYLLDPAQQPFVKLPQDMVLDLLGDVLDEVTNFCDPRLAGIEQKLRAVARHDAAQRAEVIR